MLKNYLRIALRNFRRQAGYSVLTTVGLALGLASTIIILLYVQDELSYDRYHEQADRIYRLIDTEVNDTDYAGIAKVNGPWGPTALENIPEVDQFTRFTFFGQALMRRGDVSAYETGGFFADSTVFRVFDFPLISGDPGTALAQPQSIVLTQPLAREYFGSEDPMGQAIDIDSSDPNTPAGPYTVTGILGDVPDQSHFSFRYLISMSSYRHPDMDHWVRWNQFYTYVLLRENANPDDVALRFASLLPQHLDADLLDNYQPALQPLTSIHLHSNLFREIGANGDITYVYVFAAIAVLILVVACINFINLSTARGANRMKEVGVRKAAGAHRFDLVRQFLGESFLTVFIALLAAISLVVLFLQPFNDLTGKTLIVSTLAKGWFILGVFGIWLLVGLVAGSYPAFWLSRYRPVLAFKGDRRGKGNSTLRKGLVVFQFAISAFLIIGTGVVLRQIKFIQDKKLGFNQSQLITVPIRDDAMRVQSASVKQELLRHPGVEFVSLSGNLPGGSDWGIPVRPEGIPDDEVPSTRLLAVDSDFIETFQMELVDGHDFSGDRPTEQAAGFLMNEEAARQYGWERPLEKTVAMPAIGREPGPVIGVLKDFHFRSMREEIGPLLFFSPPLDWFSLYTIRVRPDLVSEALAHIEETWMQFDPGHPFTYSFFDDQFGQLHAAEARTGELLTFFSALAILIACMGLFGLAVYTAAQRTKEIGVRKVLGASVSHIVYLLTKEFSWLVLAGFVAAAPLAYWASEAWLSDFAYQAGLSVWIFLGAGALALAVAWLTIGYHSIRAALANPVDALRYE